MKEWSLKGLDGKSSLGFLAAIGTLRIASLAWPDFRCCMNWKKAGGSWYPELFIETEEDIDISSGLANQLAKMRDHDAFTFTDDLSISPDQFAQKTLKAVQNINAKDRRFVDFLAAFGMGILGQEKKKKMSCTAFRLLGVAQTSFMGSIRIICRDTTIEHVLKAMNNTWHYSDPASEGHTMRWDPRDDVRRALRWNKPSGDPARKRQGSEWGANRLAIEGLPLLPTMPVGDRLETTGFTRYKKIKGVKYNSVYWSWPIWEGKADIDIVRSMLALSELQDEHPDRVKLSKRGICEIYRCQRIAQGKYMNFTPAVPV